MAKPTKTKTLYFRPGPGVEPQEIARIELYGDEVLVRYLNGGPPFDALQRLGTRDGILEPSDGRPYFDALELAFATSSHYFVRE